MNLIRTDLTRPSTTITAAGLAGALATIAVGILSRLGVTLTPEEAMAAGTLIIFAVGYFAEENVLPLRREADEHEGGGP